MRKKYDTYMVYQQMEGLILLCFLLFAYKDIP